MNTHRWSRKVRLSAPFAALVVLLLIVSTGGTVGAQSTGHIHLKRVSILTSFQDGPTFYPYAVARKLGYFTEEGLSVAVLSTEGSSFVTQQVLAGNVQYGMANAAASMIASTQNAGIRVPICFNERLTYTMNALKGNGVLDIKDLRGKTLGVTSTGGGEVPYAEAALEQAGLTLNKNVSILPVGDGGPAALRALKTGTISAYIASATDFSALYAEDSSLKLVNITPKNFAAIPGTCFVTTAKALANPATEKILVGILRGFAKGDVFGIANPNATARIVCADLPQTCQSLSAGLQLVRETVAIGVPTSSHVPIGGIDLAGWNAAAAVLHSSGTVTKTINVQKITESADVQRARAEILNFNAATIESVARHYRS